MRGAAVVSLDPETLAELAVIEDRPSEGRVDLGGALGEPGGLVILRFDEDEYGAEIARYDGDGAPGVLGTYSGAVTSVPLSFGTAVFESEIGDRVVVTPLGGGFTGSVPCRRPTSVRVVESSETDVTLEALAVVDGGLVSLTLRADGTGAKSCEGRPLEVAGTEDARLVDLASPVSRAVVDVSGRELVVTPLDGLRAGGAARFSCDGARLEHVVSVPEPGGETLLVALVSGPAYLVVARVAPEGGIGLSPGAVTAVKLDGEPMRADRGPSHDLAVIGRRAFVSTRAGLVAFDLSAAGDALERVTLPSGLRGPLAVIAR